MLGDVEFFGRPYFTADTGGFVVLQAGATDASVSFEKEYLEKPVINTSAQQLLTDGINFAVASASTKGFHIVLDRPASVDYTFSWIALAIKNPRIVIATPGPTPTPSETPAVTPTPTLEPTQEPTESPTPTLEPTETPEPTESPTPTPEPTESPTPTPTPTE